MFVLLLVNHLKTEGMLSFLDVNCRYNVTIEDTEHITDQKVICIEINNTDDCPEREKVPNETGIILSLKDVQYLHSFLTTYLKLYGKL